MDAAQRRAALAEYLGRSRKPVSAAALARRFSVSRQIIVGDVALLRAGGLGIAATPRGYVLRPEHTGPSYTVACLHRPEDMSRELEIMVDNGCTVQDVVVEHPIYGQLTGQLHLSSRYDVRQFVQKASARSARPLSDLTGGLHLHTLRCPDEGAYERVLEELENAGFLYQA